MTFASTMFGIVGNRGHSTGKDAGGPRRGQRMQNFSCSRAELVARAIRKRSSDSALESHFVRNGSIPVRLTSCGRFAPSCVILAPDTPFANFFALPRDGNPND
jgi:hypothetical protein